MRAFILLVLATLAFTGAASALSVQNNTYGGVSIYRISPEIAAVGQQSWVMLAFENTGKARANLTVTDLLGDADFNKSAATATNTTYGTRWTYAWDISLAPGENTSVAYWIIPKSPGEYVISPSPVVVNGVTYYLDAAYMEVACDADGRCSAGEDQFNCPEDCQDTGSPGSNQGIGVGTNQTQNQSVTAASGNQTGEAGKGEGCAPVAGLAILFLAAALARPE